MNRERLRIKREEAEKRAAMCEVRGDAGQLRKLKRFGHYPCKESRRLEEQTEKVKAEAS